LTKHIEQNSGKNWNVGITPASQKRAVKAALENPNSSIDLSLISSLSDRRDLSDQLHSKVLQTQKIIKMHGTPGIHLPSSNAAGRKSGRYLVDMSPRRRPAIVRF